MVVAATVLPLLVEEDTAHPLVEDMVLPLPVEDMEDKEAGGKVLGGGNWDGKNRRVKERAI